MTPSTHARSRDEASRRIRRNLATVALLAFATCNEQAQAPEPAGLTPARKTLGKVPTTEVATWQRSVSVTAPEGRFLQAVAVDEDRQVVVMFGGANRAAGSSTVTPTQDLWEWSPSTAEWKLRSSGGAGPAARAGAAMVYDPVRKKMVLSGGRAASGFNYEDLWGWDPATGTWTEWSSAGTRPSARAQHGMVYEKSTNKILLFGGGRSDPSASDGTSMSASLGDTWELDPATGKWTLLSPTSSPTVRHDFGLAWDAGREKVVLFGGMQVDIPGATGVPKQDTWEWDPVAQTWTERTAAGDKPSQRYGQAMAYDGSRSKVVLFGGWDMTTAGSKNDLWDFDPGTGVWTQRLTGTEAGLPGPRSYASLVYDSGHTRLDLIAGQVPYSPDVKMGVYGLVGSNEVWLLDPATATFTNASTGYQVPNARMYHTMAYNPATGGVYVFGGVDPMFKGTELNDLWEWNGEGWTEVASDQSPSGRLDTAMAYDPVRKSLILFGGNSWSTGPTPNDTWEWSSTTRQWTLVKVTVSPSARSGHALVTDTARNKILLVGGSVTSSSSGVMEMWEWDGATLSWTNRTSTGSGPTNRSYALASFDEARGKLVVYESTSAFWEWDGATGGWVLRDPRDSLSESKSILAVYDSARRRHVYITDVSTGSTYQTWELDTKAPTWYVRSPANAPGNRYRAAMVYDAGRRLVVLFGGNLNSSGTVANDTWVYSVASLANGEGCTTASATACASGNCVDGVCCETAACSGACKSCDVPGAEGTCVLAQPGTEVPGSCADGQACDATGSCKSKNGQACTAGDSCASGFCTDGVCCDSACTGPCMACNLTSRVGTCTAYVAGKDPENECIQGTGVCKATCDGVGACTFPLVSCGSCLICDGAGTCSQSDPACFGSGGVPGKGGISGSGGKMYVGGAGGSGGTVSSGGTVGSGGKASSGGTVGSGGKASSGGTVSSGGSIARSGGAGGGVVSGGTVGRSGGAGGSGGGVGGGGLGQDAGSIASGGAGGLGGAGGSGLDGGAVQRDGGLDGGALVASLQRGGCSCAMGERGFAARPWLLLMGAALWFGRRRRR